MPAIGQNKQNIMMATARYIQLVHDLRILSHQKTIWYTVRIFLKYEGVGEGLVF